MPGSRKEVKLDMLQLRVESKSLNRAQAGNSVCLQYQHLEEKGGFFYLIKFTAAEL